MKLFPIAIKSPRRVVLVVSTMLALVPGFAPASPTFSAVSVAQNPSVPDQATRKFCVRQSSYVSSQPGKYGIDLKSDGTLRLTTGGPGIGIRLQAAGFGVQRMQVSSPSVRLTQGVGQWPQVDFRRLGITESYVNGSAGLHHSFQISGRAEGQGRPWIRLQVMGADRVRSTSDDRVAVQVGDRTFTYSGLSAWDARGRILPARMVGKDGEITLSVDDAGANYPITIDPMWDQQQRFTGSDAVGGDRFGFSASMAGSTSVFGATLKNGQAGAAYVFTQTGGSWTEQQKLTASDPAAGDLFGAAVAVSGDVAAVGAYGKNGSQGAVYVFDRVGTTWLQSQKLTASDGSAGDRFGFSLSISGDTLVVGAYQQASSKGAAYVFNRSGGTWTETQKLTADDSQGADLFGYSVAVDGNQIGIGATGRSGSRGAIYAFRLAGGTWVQSQVIAASDAAASDNLGRSIALSNGRLLAGAFGKNGSQGAAYIFTLTGSTWGSETKLTANDAASGDQFGSACGLSGTTAIVAAPGCDPDGKTNAGASYVFTLESGVWSQSQKLTSSDATVSDGFGAAVATSASGMIITSWRQTASQGAAYAFGAPVASGISVSYPAMTLYGGVPGVYGGRSSMGRVTATSPAPIGGTVVSLTASIPEVSVPASVTIPAGETGADFPISAVRVPVDTPASVRAVAGVNSATGDFVVLANKVSVIRFAKPAVNRRGNILLTVSLVAPALSDFEINLTSSDPDRLNVPSRLVVLKDQTSVKVEVTAGDVDTDTPVKVVATPSNSEKSATVLVRANTDIASLSLQNSRIGVGRSTSGTVRLTGPAMAGGEDIVLESNIAEVVVPDTVHVPAGQTVATFRVESQGTSACTAKIAASVNDSATSKVLTVVRPKLDSISVSPGTVRGGTPSELTMNLAADAPTEGVTIRLASSNSAIASVPSSVVIPEGARSFRVKITTSRWSNASPKSIKITAAIPGDSAKVGFVIVTR